MCGAVLVRYVPIQNRHISSVFPFNNPIVSFIAHKKMCRSDRKWLSYISWPLSCSVSLHCPADDWQLCNQLQAGFSGSTSSSLINYWRHFSLLRTPAVLRVAVFTALLFVTLEQQQSCMLNSESVITGTRTREDEEEEK